MKLEIPTHTRIDTFIDILIQTLLELDRVDDNHD